MLAVLLYHAFPALVPGGYVGVDVFFVISGFLITSILLKDIELDRFSLLDFYGRRIRRIFPALTLVLVSGLVLGWNLLTPEHLSQLGKHVIAGAAFVSNIVLWKEAGYFDSSAELKPYLHLWSLGIEEQFYFIWPIFIYLIWRKSLNLFAVCGLVIALSFAFNVTQIVNHRTFTFYSPLTRFWELTIGSALAASRFGSIPPALSNLRSRLLLPARSALSVAGTLLVLIGVFCFNKEDPYPGWRALLPTVGAAMIISAGRGAVVNSACLSRKWMVAVGLISYPLYLWHWLLLSFIRIVVQDPSDRLFALALVVSFLLAALTYRLVERPVRACTFKAGAAIGLAFVMTGVAIVGTAFYINEGFPQRLPEPLHKISTIKREDFRWDEKVRSGGCHLYDPLLDAHAEECIEKTRPLVMLWGDSYAAALYPGLRQLQQHHEFGIAQLTSAACPPILDIRYSGHRSNCDDINRHIMDKLSSMKPDIIIMHTTWNSVDYNLPGDKYIALLRDTIARVRERTPQSRIVIMGPVPMWLHPLQECAIRYYLSHHQEMPERMSYCLRRSTEGLDRDMEVFSSSVNAQYVSLFRQLCNSDGCLTRVGQNWEQMESIDGGHISAATSEFLLERSYPKLFGNPEILAR